jgi:hypothetical protein
MSTRFQKDRIKPTKSKRYTKEQLENALTKLIKSTAGLRSLSGGVWSKPMCAKATKASGDIIPQETLKRRFVKWMAEEASPSDKTAKTKANADARGILKSLEMKQLYNWIEYMRQQYTPVTRVSLRSQVRELACSERQAGMAIWPCCLTATDDCACRLQTFWRHGAFSMS